MPTTPRARSTVERRPAAVKTRRALAPQASAQSPARRLQARVGNQGAQPLIARVVGEAALQRSPAAGRAAVSSTSDPSEREAESVARSVVRMQDPPQISTSANGAQRAADSDAPAPRTVTRAGISGGAPLPGPLLTRMQARFGADFSAVRIHTDVAAGQQSERLNAHAFTIGEHIFFGRGKFQPESESGQELIAHELTHTIQQGAAVQIGARAPVGMRSPMRIQRLGISDVIDWIADKANLLPGFRLLTVVLGVNPINRAPVARNAANLLRGLLELVPVAGALISQALANYGIFDKVGAWLTGKIRELGLVGAAIKTAFYDFLDSLGVRDVFSPSDVYARGKRIFTDPIDRLIAFCKSVATDILTFIRDAILMPLGRLAAGTRGYDLLRAVLGRDPVTGEAVQRTPEALIGGFMKFIGQEQIWENAKKANAVPRVWAWFQGALRGLLGFVGQLPALFIGALRGLEIFDLVLPPRAFVKLVRVFGGFATQFTVWAGGTIWRLLEIVFEVVSPGALAYIKRTGTALHAILKNPLPFARNLVRAARLGFQNFADNFGAHFKNGLIDWLTGSLNGVYIPKALTLPELGKFAISVLGVSWAQIRAKIVKALGPRGAMIMKTLETSFDIVVALVTGGPAAAWDLIKEKLTALKDQVISGITAFVMDTVVKKAIPKLLSMFIPGAGFISAIVSIYDTIVVFINKLASIAQVVAAFVESILAIAGGNIGMAVQRVERVLGKLLSLSISFMAGFLGLGDIASKLNDVISKLRATVDKALDSAVAWIVEKAKALLQTGKQAVQRLIAWWKTKVSFKAGAESHALYFKGEQDNTVLTLASTPQPLEDFLDKHRDDDKNATTLKEINKHLAAIEKIKKSAAPKDEDKDKPPDDKDVEKMQKAIETEMNAIGQLLVTLLVGDDWGTEKSPAPFEYPKRRAEAYPVFYLATGTYKGKTQSALRAAFYKNESGKPKASDQIVELRPTALTELPGSAKKLGLSAGSQISVGAKRNFSEKGERKGEVAAFKTLVKEYGYTPSEHSLDVDHVVELQIGGEDAINNLWPLPKGENRSSGAIIKRDGKVKTTKDGGQVTVEKALEQLNKRASKKKQSGIWLIITSTRQL